MATSLERVVIKPIEIGKLPQFPLSESRHLPYFRRTESHHAPSSQNERIAPSCGIYRQDEVDTMINSHECQLSPGGKKLLKALLKDGGIAMFGTEQKFELGVDYDNIYKTNFNHDAMDDILRDLGTQMQQDAEARGVYVDGVLGPEMSGIKMATELSRNIYNKATGRKASSISINKNGHSESPFSAAIDSYTKGKIDVMSFTLDMLDYLKSFKGDEEINLVLGDDIIDSGLMTEAIAVILQLARDQGHKVNLIGVVAPIEKLYTGAREKIKEDLGNVPIYSALKIEDMGVYRGKQGEEPEQPWIKIQGIPKALPCNLKDSRVGVGTS